MMTDPMTRRPATLTPATLTPALAWPRRAALVALLAAAGGGCSVLPDRPWQETQRFVLAPERPGGRVLAPPRAPVLMLRTLGTAPGLEVRGLRILRPEDRVTVEYWSEWAAPPGEAAEDALRRWLSASGQFSAVVAPGSLLGTEYALEGQLTRLQAEPAAGVARATLALLLMETGAETPRLRRQVLAEGRAPLPGGARPDGRITPEEAAQAMSAALGDALAQVEAQVGASLAPTRGAPARRR
jgi:ABC-type uncharacterized transport system auxiliary subunit